MPISLLNSIERKKRMTKRMTRSNRLDWMLLAGARVPRALVTQVKATLNLVMDLKAHSSSVVIV